AGLAIADDQLALAAADGNQGVERLEAGLHRLIDRLARDDAWRLDLDAAALGRFDRALAIDRIAKRIDDAAEQRLADRNVDDGAGPLDAGPFGDVRVRTEDHDADIVGLEVERHALGAVVEFDRLAGLDVVEAVDASDAVTARQDGPDFRNLRFGVEIRDLVADDAGDFSGADIHGSVLAFHRQSESVEFGADRGVDLLAAQLDDDSAEDGGIDDRVARDVASGASAELRFERRDLVVVEGPGGDDLGGLLAAMLGGKPPERADDAAKLILAAVASERAKEVRCDWVEAELRSQSGEGLAGLVAADQRARNQLREILRIEQGLAERVEAVADGFDLPLVAGEVEQGRRVAPC